MKFKWYTLVLLAIGISPMACNDDETPTNEKCLLTGYTSTANDGNSIVRYENTWNADTLLTTIHTYTGQVKEEVPLMTSQLGYDVSGRITTMNTTRTSTGVPYKPLTFVYDYDNQNRMIRQTSAVGEYNITLTYNSDNRISQVTYLSDLEGNDTSAYYLNTYDNRGNIVREDAYEKNDEGKMAKASTTVYAYDDKKNPMVGNYYEYADDPAQHISINNIVSKTVNDVTEIFTYEYNELGYPVAKVSNSKSGYTVTYRYQCAR